MTCIAYRDGVMSYDTMALYGTIKVLNDVKCFKLETDQGRHLVGASGSNCPSIKQLKEWYQECLVKPKPLKDFKFQVLAITPDNVVTNWDHTGSVDTIAGVPFYAIGAGQEFAMGAMAMGATAPQAVEVAIKWSSGCAGEVRSIE